ncbi:MAG: hypothetical protein DSY90_14385 [Deltaproteobacteria bacterium]|nr:MAG: hypothetical protein DSY90_14385 [Deltaproteobacteria bacterium]
MYPLRFNSKGITKNGSNQHQQNGKINSKLPFVNPLTFHNDRARQNTLLACFPEVGDIRGTRKMPAMP